MDVTDTSGQRWPLHYALTAAARAGRWEIAALDPAPALDPTSRPAAATPTPADSSTDSGASATPTAPASPDLPASPDPSTSSAVGSAQPAPPTSSP